MTTNKVEEKFTIIAQYVKDLSFEVPGAPKYFFEKIEEKPSIEVAVDIKANKVNEGLFTVSLITKVHNKIKDSSLFLAEVEYQCVVRTEIKDKKEEERVLLVDAPHLIFPFVREIISSLTKDSGFPPIVLSPINFEEMYNSRKVEVANS